MSEKSDEWQLVVVGVSDQDDIDHGNSPNPCRDAKTLAEFARCMGFCSEPVVFAERSPVDEDAQQNLQKGLTEKLTEAAKKMRDKNIKKLMVYYAGHGESVGESRTVSVDLDLVLEEAVVSAVEENELKYVCVIVLLDCCRNKAEDSPACKTGTFPSESNTYVYVYFGELYYPLRNSSLVPAALMHMIQAQSDCTISDFLLRMSQLLLQVTLGRINMEWAGLSRSNAALWPFFPAGRVCLLDREQVDVMPQQHYDALRNTFCVYGCLDCIVDYAVSLPMMLKDTKVMLKDKEKQLSASKPKLRHAIPSYGCLDCIMDCAKSLSVMLKGTKAKLKNVEADPEILREDEEIQLPASPTLRHMIPELRSIAESFFGKTYLFLDDWRQELDVAMCESLEEVEETLEKVAQEPGPSASFSNLQQRLPDSLRRCVLNARRDCYRRHQREGLMHTDHVIEVLQTLECYFDKLPLSAKESLEIKELDAEEGRKDEIPVLYAFVINDISASGIPEQQLRDLEKIVDSVDGKDVVKYGSRFFLSTGSLWIILQSAKLDDKTFRSVHRQLEAWTKQLRQSRAAWHAARLQVVPRPAVPAGLQKLVHELCAANLATGPVVKLTADHVRELVAKRRGVSPSRLHVFEGERSARGWLQRGGLRFTEAKDWKVLMQDMPSSLSESLQKLAEKTCGRQLWGDSAEFQAAAFLLHHRRARLVSAAQVDMVSNAAAMANSPEEFLNFVIQEHLKKRSFDPVDLEPMSDEPDEWDEWQLVAVGVCRKGEMYTNCEDDEDGAHPARDAKIFAEFATLICFCSEPVVFAIELESEPEGDQVELLQEGLRETLNTAAQRMKEKNIKKMMVYYGGHGESIDAQRTVSLELGLVLEDEVVRAVELADLEYVCAIVLLDCGREKLHKSSAQAVPPLWPRNTYLFGYFCHLGHRIRPSSLVPAALMHMMLSEKEDCDIAMFFTRLKRVLRDITGGRTDMQMDPVQFSAADQDFFPAKCLELKLPFERTKGRVLEDEEYEALRDTFAIYGHCDCIMDNVYETGVVLQEMLEDTKQMVKQDGQSHVPASKHTLRHLIPQLQRIAKVFHKKKELFRSDWKQELEVVGWQKVGRTSFEEVLKELEKVTEASEDLGSSRPRIPEVVRRCVVEARHRYFSQEGEQDLMSYNHVEEVLEKLSDRFTQLPLKSASCVLTVPHDPQEAYFIYTLSIEIDVWYVGISASSVAEEQWAQLRTYFTHGADGAGASAYETTICVG